MRRRTLMLGTTAISGLALAGAFDVANASLLRSIGADYSLPQQFVRIAETAATPGSTSIKKTGGSHKRSHKAPGTGVSPTPSPSLSSGQGRTSLNPQPEPPNPPRPDLNTKKTQ